MVVVYQNVAEMWLPNTECSLYGILKWDHWGMVHLSDRIQVPPSSCILKRNSVLFRYSISINFSNSSASVFASSLDLQTWAERTCKIAKRFAKATLTTEHKCALLCRINFSVEAIYMLDSIKTASLILIFSDHI